MILPPVQVIGECSAGLAVCHCLAVGIGNQQVEPTSSPLLHFDLQGVIAGVVAIAGLIEALRETEFLEIETSLVKVTASGHGAVWIGSGLVHVRINKQVPAYIADISGLHCKTRIELMLHSQIPGVGQRNAIRARWIEEVIDVQSVR